MKRIYYVNVFAIGLPISLGLLGILFNALWLFALLSTMLTGLIQVVLGLCLFFDNPKDNGLRIYLGAVMIYFLLWFAISKSTNSYDIFIYVLVLIPAVLATYLTIIIYKKLNL